MPFLMAKTNVPIGRAKEMEIKTLLGKAIGLVPGKSEQSLLVGFEENRHFYLRGEEQPVVYIEASIFGNEAHLGYDALTAAIARAFHDVLEIPPENIYVKYDDIKGWGVGDAYFDRGDFQ
ncbi:MAG: hypothetical protein IJ741_03460 [Schwartzia sp.]|nr:hypothetical protein [Schwartzia sp. (in: firmicutes)]MBR1760218.1 hypothetical protein [Schwartzia sp. (in: firmicutes)]